ncbi:hypothetical protein GCM10027430_21070 [Lysobacter tyrosinilyticus]
MPRWAGWGALVSCALAAVFFGGRFDAYSHLQHPLALLGARGVPDALWFNVLAFVLPGVLAIAIAYALRQQLSHGVPFVARIGAWMVLLSACAFAAQGLLPLDPNDLEARASQRHAAAWMLWVLGFGAGSAALALGLARANAWRGIAWASALAALLVPVLALFGAAWIGAGLAQRAALAVWLVWLVLVARRSSRS